MTAKFADRPLAGQHLPEFAAEKRRPRSPRVSIYLLVSLVILALVAPAVGFLAHIVAQQNQQRELEVSRRGEGFAGEISASVEQELRTMKTILAVFLSSGWLEENQLEALHRRARHALSGSGRYLVVLNSELEEILNTRVPFASEIGRTPDALTAADVLEHGSEVVSDVVRGRVVDGLVFNIMRPVEFPDGRELILMLGREAAGLERLLGSVQDSDGWSFAVLDGSGQVVTSAIAPEQPNTAYPESCLDTVFGFRSWGSPGREQYVFDRALRGAPWTVCVWGAAERLEAEAEQSWTTLFSATVAWFGLALLAAGALSASISRAISDTAKVGEALETGRDVTVPSSYIREVDEVRSSLSRAGADRLRKEQELQLLLRETAHRAKNQIALAVSLVGLSARNVATVEDLRRDLTDRLVALGRSIDAMAGRTVDAAPLRELVEAQLGPFLDQGEGRLRTDGGEVHVVQSAAQSLSLVLHELATNASKYGGWSVPEGSVSVAWRAEAGKLILEWTESGVFAQPPERTGFGTKLTDILIERSMGGAVERDFSPEGFRCRISVPLAATTAPAPRSETSASAPD